MPEFAGTLRERVVVEALSGTRTTTGLQVAEWVRVAECAAAVRPDGVGALAEAGALSAMARYRVRLRARGDVAVGHRLRWRKLVLSVRQVVLDPQQADRMVLKCEEVRG